MRARVSNSACVLIAGNERAPVVASSARAGAQGSRLRNIRQAIKPRCRSCFIPSLTFVLPQTGREAHSTKSGAYLFHQPGQARYSVQRPRAAAKLTLRAKPDDSQRELR